MGKEKYKKILLEKEVAMKTLTLSLVDLEMTVNSLEVEKSLLMNTNKELVSYSSETATSNIRVTEEFLKYITSLYLGFAINVKKAILRYCSREVSEIILCILKQRRKWKLRSEEIEENGVRREHDTILRLQCRF